LGVGGVGELLQRTLRDARAVAKVEKAKAAMAQSKQHSELR